MQPNNHLVVARRTRLTAEERRERILQAALEVFAARGYREASMAVIAEAAGITPAVIYDHFSSKEGLYTSLLEQKTQEVLVAVGSAVAAAPDDRKLRLRAGVDAFFAFVEQHGFAWWLLFRDPPADPSIAATYGQLQQTATLGIAAFLRESAPPALLERPDAERDLEMFAQLLRTAQNGLAAWWFERRDVPRDVVVDRIVEFCWLGLERVSRGERA
jgi:AcrR family transcriptional regulator